MYRNKILEARVKQFSTSKFEGETLAVEQGIKKNAEAIHIAIQRACRDIMPRTLKAKSDTKELKSDMYSVLVNRIKVYFDGEPLCEKQFDEWHHETCEEARKILEKYYDGVFYGKAQKVVNMTFKGLYCVADDAEKQYFEHCHVPLDSFTLEWLCRNAECKVERSIEKNKRTKRSITKTYLRPWSALKYENDGEYYTYKVLSMAFRKELRNKYSMFPIEAEFIIWPEIQMELCAEAFIKQMSNYITDDNSDSDDTSKLKSIELPEKLKMVQGLLDNYIKQNTED